MANEFQKLSGDYQRTGKEAISSMLRSAGDYRKSLEEISFELGGVLQEIRQPSN